MNQPLFETTFRNLKLLRRGKVRDVYDLGTCLLIVATDRLSAFDVVLPDPIPLKGKVLTQISNYWFEATRDIVENHIIATEVDDFPKSCRSHREELEGRSVLVKKATPVPFECVARGYLAGSGWSEYQESRSVCGITLPLGLVESSILARPIFTPATKAVIGHDENVSLERMCAMVGSNVGEQMRELTLRLYDRGCRMAEEKGIIIADTKMEFGLIDGRLILIDELLTPDSSRFWPAAGYAPGKSQQSYDKQFVRDYLLSIGFNKQPPGPRLPEEVIRKTTDLYREALLRLTGQRLTLAE